jgi:hypothetical protein
VVPDRVVATNAMAASSRGHAVSLSGNIAGGDQRYRKDQSGYEKEFTGSI